MYYTNISRHPPIDLFCTRLEKAGFDVPSVLAHCSECFMKLEVFLDPQGPLDAKWRGLHRYTMLISMHGIGVYVSTWSLATPDELEQALSSWKKKLEDGTADDFIKEKEVIRKEIGHSTTIIAYKR